MAPPTIPTEVKKRRGTLRADRTPVGNVMPVDRAPSDMPPPATLREAGKAEWRHSLLVCRWIAHSDLTALRMLCEAIDRREDLNKELTKPGAALMLETSTGYAYVNPAASALEKTEERISKWMTVLGMTPSARGALGVAEVHQASVLDKLGASRRGQGGLPASTPPSPTPTSSTETGTRSSSSSRRTGGSRRTPSPARRALPSTLDTGSDSSSGRPSPETL